MVILNDSNANMMSAMFGAGNNMDNYLNYVKSFYNNTVNAVSSTAKNIYNEIYSKVTSLKYRDEMADVLDKTKTSLNQDTYYPIDLDIYSYDSLNIAMKEVVNVSPDVFRLRKKQIITTDYLDTLKEIGAIEEHPVYQHFVNGYQDNIFVKDRVFYSNSEFVKDKYRDLTIYDKRTISNTWSQLEKMIKDDIDII